MMEHIIRLDTYRRDRRVQGLKKRHHEIQAGLQFAERAMRIMIEEAHERGDIDIPTVWHRTMIAAITGLKKSGWNTEDFIRLINHIRHSR